MKNREKTAESGFVFKPRNGCGDTWIKRSAALDEGICDIYGTVYDATIENYSEYEIANWVLRVDIKQKCYINNCWCGIVEIHQTRAGDFFGVYSITA